MKKTRSVMGIVILLTVYCITAVLTVFSARSGRAMMIGNSTIPLSVFTGVFSSISNIITFLLVVFYRKKGLIISLFLILANMPSLIMEMVRGGNLISVSGLFTSLFTIIAIIVIYRSGKEISEYQAREIENLKEKQQISQKLFEQTATALVNAIDAKDNYSHGHSLRVAEYSEKIARELGKSDEECSRIHYAALLHDVGKIGINEAIINKKGKLTSEEYEEIKRHPKMGNQILSSINEYPYLSIGAHYHHERYDGKGYPDRLKGEDIPEIARIISVADAYDAMSSNRSYRNALPQQIVREEIIKGAGTQFDPVIAQAMQKLIDSDTEYQMKERSTVRELAGRNEIHIGEFRNEISDGIAVTPFTTKIQLVFTPEDVPESEKSEPALILFDSLDERVHEDAKTIKDLNYYEYCEIFFDGRTVNKGVRKIQTDIAEYDTPRVGSRIGASIRYNIEMVKFKDHAIFNIDDGLKNVSVIVAFPDSARYAYVGLTGRNCIISDVSISKADVMIDADRIPRIAEEISYTDGPEGDIPNIQIDGFRYDSTEGIPVTDSMKISFHTMSLPTARLVWHCPYIVIFYSDDKKVNGADYREYALVRLDGEDWKSEDRAENHLTVDKTDKFEGWDAWKRANKEGFDCTVTIRRNKDTIEVSTENLGLVVRDTVTITDGTKELYASLTGDQCAITNIRIER